MGSLQIVNKDSGGKIKQDYLAKKEPGKERVVEVDKLKKAQAKK